MKHEKRVMLLRLKSLVIFLNLFKAGSLRDTLSEIHGDVNPLHFDLAFFIIVPLKLHKAVFDIHPEQS